LVVQTVFERVDGFVIKQDPFLALESIDCVDYTDPSLGIHPTTTREGSKSVNHFLLKPKEATIAHEMPSKALIVLKPASKESIALETPPKASIALKTPSKASIVLATPSKASIVLETPSKASIILDMLSKICQEAHCPCTQVVTPEVIPASSTPFSSFLLCHASKASA
jgi:hypothetical protein